MSCSARMDRAEARASNRERSSRCSRTWKYDGQVMSFGDLDLGGERFFLPIVVWAVGHVVDADFTHHDDAFVRRQGVEGCYVFSAIGASRSDGWMPTPA